MTDDYYAPQPRLLISRPLVLVGHPGAGVDPIGRGVAGRTGLPLNQISRSLEARAGRSSARILVESGINALRRLEASALEQALRRHPFGIITLDSGALEDDDARDATLSAADVLWIRRPTEVLLARIRRSVTESPGSVPEFVMAMPSLTGELEAHLASREMALREVSGILDAGDLGATEVANDIIKTLGPLTGKASV
jgi:shikimate kinase